jgi:hypothetical protein
VPQVLHFIHTLTELLQGRVKLISFSSRKRPIVALPAIVLETILLYTIFQHIPNISINKCASLNTTAASSTWQAMLINQLNIKIFWNILRSSSHSVAYKWNFTLILYHTLHHVFVSTMSTAARDIDFLQSGDVFTCGNSVDNSEWCKQWSWCNNYYSAY